MEVEMGEEAGQSTRRVEKGVGGGHQSSLWEVGQAYDQIDS